LSDLYDGQQLEARRRQLKSQRDAVQALADLQDGRSILMGDLEGKRGGGSAFDKQADGFVTCYSFEAF
jgi:hypothetical protein